MVDQDQNGRPHGSAWRALHAEGILWDGQVLVAGAGAELPLRLIATTQRLTFTKGGAFVLDVPGEWLEPCPHLNPDGSINLTIDAADGGRPERLRLVVRDGRRLAVDLIAALNKSKSQISRSMPIYAPEPVAEMPEPPMARGKRSVPPRQRKREPDDLNPIAALDPDDFPPLTTAPPRSKQIKIDDDLPPAAVDQTNSGPLQPSARDASWVLQPISHMSNRTNRHARRSWAIRLSGLIVLLALAAASGSGRLPTIPGRDIASHMPDTSINAPFSEDEPEPTAETSSMAHVVPPTATSTSTVTPPVQSTTGAVQPTTPPSKTAISLGVGGGDASTQSSEVEPTRTTSSTDTPTNEPEVVIEADEPEPTDEPMAVPSAEPTLEPTATAQPAPAETVEAEPTAAPTDEPTADPTSTGTATVEVPPTDIPAVTEPPTPEPTATQTSTETATATITPTPTATVKVDFPAQGATLGEGELPEQAFTDGAFRFTVEGVIRGATIDEVALTPVSGADWVLIVLYAQNWSEEKASLAIADFQLLSYGDFGVQGSTVEPASGVVAETLGFNPALGSADSASFGVDRGFRLALAYLIRPDATVLQLTIGETTIDLGESMGQPIAPADLGPEPDQPDLIAATVTRIVDGEMIYVEVDGARARLRYLGVKAPSGSACYAAESKAANAALVEGKTVYLEREFKNRETGVGLVRDVWIVSKDGGLTLVAAELAAIGAVIANPVEPDVRFGGWIRAAEDGAQFANAGLWGACGGLQTPTPEPTVDPLTGTPANALLPETDSPVIEQGVSRMGLY